MVDEIRVNKSVGPNLRIVLLTIIITIMIIVLWYLYRMYEPLPQELAIYVIDFRTKCTEREIFPSTLACYNLRTIDNSTQDHADRSTRFHTGLLSDSSGFDQKSFQIFGSG